MSDEWKKPLWENLHHLTTAILFLCMLVYDFLPLVLMLLLMRASEWLVREKNYALFGTPLDISAIAWLGGGRHVGCKVNCPTDISAQHR
jgi:hypothetical protein